MSSFVPGVESGSVDAEPSSVTRAPPGRSHSAVPGAAMAACGPDAVTSTSVRSVVRWKIPKPEIGRVLPSVAVITSAYGFAGTRFEMSIAGGRPDVKGTSTTTSLPAIRNVADPESIARTVQSIPVWLPLPGPPAACAPPTGRTQTVAGSDRSEIDNIEAKPPRSASHGPYASS